MHINILTIFPDFFRDPLSSSMLKRAVTAQVVQYQVINIRDFASGKHQHTDDRPFGGGPGMVMQIEPIDLALRSLGVARGQASSQIVLTSAKGSVFTQSVARDWSSLQTLTIICGHYEGVDERVAEHLIDAEVRIGDYVLTGGEPAALVMVDAVTRLLPGVLGNEASPIDESHSVPGVLGHPQYTRPEEYRGWRVPEVLLGGNHAVIEEWRSAKKTTPDHRS